MRVSRRAAVLAALAIASFTASLLPAAGASAAISTVSLSGHVTAEGGPATGVKVEIAPKYSDGWFGWNEPTYTPAVVDAAGNWTAKWNLDPGGSYALWYKVPTDTLLYTASQGTHGQVRLADLTADFATDGAGTPSVTSFSTDLAKNATIVTASFIDQQTGKALAPTAVGSYESLSLSVGDISLGSSHSGSINHWGEYVWGAWSWGGVNQSGAAPVTTGSVRVAHVPANTWVGETYGMTYDAASGAPKYGDPEVAPFTTGAPGSTLPLGNLIFDRTTQSTYANNRSSADIVGETTTGYGHAMHLSWTPDPPADMKTYVLWSHGANMEPIIGASGPTYALGARDIGKTVNAAITVRRDGYIGASGSWFGNTPITEGSAPSPSVSTSGTGVVGTRITASVAAPGATLSYQWLRAGTPIAGATHSSYKTGKVDVGRKISVAVTSMLDGTRPVSIVSTGRTVTKDAASLLVRAPKTLSAHSKGVVKVTVKAGPSHMAPTGTVRVYYSGKHFVKATVRHGKVTLHLPRLRAGKHTVTIRYYGSPVYGTKAIKVRISVHR